MRLIDADWLIHDLKEHKIPFNADINEAIIIAPTVDAVEVIRCKDCRYWDAFPTASSTPYMHECSCRYPRRGTSANDFCSWGKRRVDENE